MTDARHDEWAPPSDDDAPEPWDAWQDAPDDGWVPPSDDDAPLAGAGSSAGRGPARSSDRGGARSSSTRGSDRTCTRSAVHSSPLFVTSTSTGPGGSAGMAQRAMEEFTHNAGTVTDGAVAPWDRSPSPSARRGRKVHAKAAASTKLAPNTVSSVPPASETETGVTSVTIGGRRYVNVTPSRV